MKLYVNLAAAVMEYIGEEEEKRAARRELICLAVLGIEEFYRQRDFYREQVKECSLFIKEMHASLQALSIAIREGAGEDMVFDCCFELFEVLCPILREASLARHYRTEVEEQLLDYFEGCGHWASSDMTLVTEMYYQTLPGKYASH